VDGRRLNEYAKRFAFVAHDVKTVSSQLSLVLANAEDNIQDPEFQKDMLLTVRAATTRIDTLIARLRGDKDEAAPASGLSPITKPADVVAPLCRIHALARGRVHPVRVEELRDAASGRATMAPDHFDEVVTHLLDNASEASPADQPVRVRVCREDDGMVVEIIDAGPGMTAEFIRDELFRPFRTTKAHGNGIGAWQARDLVRQVGGELEARSTPGHGTTMRISLPAARTLPEAASRNERIRA
jgi:signal transduction histidine kinase